MPVELIKNPGKEAPDYHALLDEIAQVFALVPDLQSVITRLKEGSFDFDKMIELCEEIHDSKKNAEHLVHFMNLKVDGNDHMGGVVNNLTEAHDRAVLLSIELASLAQGVNRTIDNVTNTIIRIEQLKDHIVATNDLESD